MSTALTFRPDLGCRLLSFAAEARPEYLDEIDRDDHQGRTFAAGNLEGELAFALAIDPRCVDSTVRRCQDALLLRLGLRGDALTLEQERLRGWVVGLLGGLAATLEEGSAE